MVNPTNNPASFSSIPTSPFEEDLKKALSLNNVTLDPKSPLFNTEVLYLLPATFGLEINRLDKVCEALEIEELDQVIHSVINLDTPGAMKARILLPQIIAQGPTIWKRLIPILKANPQENKELFFWLIRSEAGPTINAADLMEIEGYLGELASKHFREFIPNELDVGDIITSSRQIMMWGRFFVPETVTTMLSNIDQLADNNDKATLLVLILLFCFPCPVEIPRYEWITEGQFENFKTELQEFQNLYTIGDRISKNKLMSVLNLNVPSLTIEIYVKSKLASLAPQDLPAAANLYNYPMLWYFITNYLNCLPEPLPLSVISPLVFNSTTFLYLSDYNLKVIFGPDCILKGFRDCDINLIRENVLFILSKFEPEQVKKNSYGIARRTIIFLCFLERWSLVFPELKAELHKFHNLKQIELTLRRVDSSIAGMPLMDMFSDFVCRQLGEDGVDRFIQQSISLTNNPGGFTYETHPGEFCRLILNSADDPIALGGLGLRKLINIILSQDFFKTLAVERQYDDVFKLYLTLRSPEELKEWIKVILMNWITNIPTFQGSLRTLEIVKEILPSISKPKHNQVFIKMIRPGGLLLGVMGYLLENRCLTTKQLGEWSDNLLHADNTRGDKAFWTQAYALMKKHVTGSRKELNQFIPRWKLFEERIKNANEAPDKTSQIVQQNLHQSNSVPLSLAIQPAAPALVETPHKSPIENLNEYFIPLLQSPTSVNDLFGTILAGGPGLWTFIVQKLMEMSEPNLMRALKTITLIRNIPDMIQPREKDREWLDQQQQKVGSLSEIVQEIIVEIESQATPAQANMLILRQLGRVRSDEVLKALGEPKKCDHFNIYDADILLTRLLYTDCDERLLADLDEWELFFNKTPLPFYHECIDLLKEILSFRKRARLGTGTQFLKDLNKRPLAISKPVLNIISAQLTAEDLLFIINTNTDDVLILRIVAQAMLRLYNASENGALSLTGVAAKAVLINNLLFQIDSAILSDCFRKDPRCLEEKHPLEAISNRCGFILNDLKTPNPQLSVPNLALLSIVMRVIWSEGLSNIAFKEFFDKIMSNEILKIVGMNLSTLSFDIALHRALFKTWYELYDSVPAPTKLSFNLHTLSTSSIDITKESLDTPPGTIALLKDIGLTSNWYANNRPKVIRVFTSDYFFDVLTKTDFIFPDFIKKIIGRTTLHDSAAEIYLKYFKGEKKLEEWLKKFIKFCLTVPHKISNPRRFQELVEALNPSAALLDEMMTVAVPSPLATVILTKVDSRRFVATSAAKPQLLNWMDNFLVHSEGTFDDWTKALDLFKALKPQPKQVPRGKFKATKPDQFTMEFDQKVVLFNKKIKQLAVSDTEIERQIKAKIASVKLSINSEQKRLTEQVNNFIELYEKQLVVSAPEAVNEDNFTELKKVIAKLKNELKVILGRFETFLKEASAKFEKTQLTKSLSENLKNIEAWETDTQNNLKVICEDATKSINYTKSEIEIAKSIQEKFQLMILNICGEKEIQKNRINQLTLTYKIQMGELDHAILGEEALESLQTLLCEIEKKLADLDQLFEALIAEVKALFIIATTAETSAEKLQNVDGWVSQVNEKMDRFVEAEIDSLKKLETDHLNNLREFHRKTELRKRQLELDTQIHFPKAVITYEQAIANYKNALLDLKHRFSDEIEDSQIAEITTLFHKTMAQIAEAAVPKAPSTSPSPDSRLKTKIAKLKERETVFQNEIQSLQDRIEQQNDEISELKYRQYTPEQLIEKHLSTRNALIVNLEKLVEANKHVFAAAAINKIIQCEGKILSTLPEIFKVLKLAGFKKVNVVGNHRKYVGQFTKVTIFNHTNQSYDIEILKVLEKLLETSEHWLNN